MAVHRDEVAARENRQRREKDAADQEETLKKRWTINPKKQARHVEGTKEYEEYAEKLKGKGQKPSILTLPAARLQKILDDKEGAWTRVLRKGKSGERWEAKLDRIVGLWYDKIGQGPVETDVLVVTLSNTGAHVYPRWPSWREES